MQKDEVDGMLDINVKKSEKGKTINDITIFLEKMKREYVNNRDLKTSSTYIENFSNGLTKYNTVNSLETREDVE